MSVFLQDFFGILLNFLQLSFFKLQIKFTKVLLNVENKIENKFQIFTKIFHLNMDIKNSLTKKTSVSNTIKQNILKMNVFIL